MMNKTCFRFKYAIAVSLLLTIFTPAKTLMCQQRSTYDLASWIIGSIASYDTSTVNWALNEGAQIDLKRGGMNALEYAIYFKKSAMVKFLLQKGASVDSVFQDGMNALQYAEKIGNPEIIELIKNKSTVSTAVKPVLTANMPTDAPNATQQVPTIYKAGDKVLHSRDRGKTWEPGTIKEVSTNKSLLADGISPYLVENSTKTSENYLDVNFITTFNRQPSWTSFFVGDWDLNSPIAATERIINRDVYQIISGGTRLPPIRINADGTYIWVIDKKNVIKQKWINNTNAPGIILLKGYRGIDWLVYNSSDSKNRKIFKTDYIIIADPKGNYLANHGFKITKK